MRIKDYPITFALTIGDWSGDGHEASDTFLVNSARPLEEVREAHFHIQEVTGVDIEAICSKVGDDVVPREVWAKLKALGYSSELIYLDSPVNAQDMADIWVFLLNQVDPRLSLVRVSEPHYPQLHFYGNDEQGRHIGSVGYGVFYD